MSEYWFDYIFTTIKPNKPSRLACLTDLSEIMHIFHFFSVHKYNGTDTIHYYHFTLRTTVANGPYYSNWINQ